MQSIILLSLLIAATSAGLFKNDAEEEIGKHVNLTAFHEVVDRLNAKLSVVPEEQIARAEELDAKLDPPTDRDQKGDEILNINKDIVGDLIEGDILPSDEDIAELNAASEEGERKKRQADPKLLWPTADKGTIPYYFGTQAPVSQLVRTMVKAATKFWTDNTCVTFVESSSPTAKIQINSLGGCYSELGMKGRDQSMSLYNGDAGNPGCTNFALVTHEFGHSLGVNHQQTRLDRDSYIFVDENNIQSSVRVQYKKKEGTVTFGLPYDYGSVLHYSPNSAQIDYNKPTIVALNKEYQQSFGGQSPSFIDLALVNKLYGCEAKCRSPLACKNGGYVHPKKCNECICPEGWGGWNCESNPAGATVLSAGANFARHTINTSGAATIIPTTRFVVITAPVGKRVEVKFDSLQTTNFDSACELNGVEVKTKIDLRTRGFRLCGASAPTRSYRSEGNRLVIVSWFTTGSASANIQYKIA